MTTRKRYQEYLFTGGPVPRTTVWRQKKRKRQRNENLARERDSPFLYTNATVKQGNSQDSVIYHQEASLIMNQSEVQQTITTAEEINNAKEISTYVEGSCENVEVTSSSETTLQLQDCNESVISNGSGNLSFGSGSESDTGSTANAAQNPQNIQSYLHDFLSTSMGGKSQKKDIHTSQSNHQSDKKLSQEKICQCSDTSVGDVIFMCLVLGLRHNLTWEAQLDILKMINNIFTTNKLPQTKYMYFKEIGEDFNEDVTYHIFCPDCNHLVGKKRDLKGTYECKFCNRVLQCSDSKNHFISLSIESQVQRILKDKDAVDLLLNHRFTRKKKNLDALEDIFDGEAYQFHVKDGGLLSSPYNFSFSVFTDGVSPGKSTGKTMWPIYLTLNEFPPTHRSKYLILAGLYIGNKDPNVHIFLNPFVEEMNKLTTEGIKWFHNDNEVCSKFVCLCCISDSVARCKLMNMKSFASYWGCTFCYHKSERTLKGPKFVLKNEKPEERTASSLKVDLVQAFEKRNEPKEEDRHWRGVKGPSIFSLLFIFNFFVGFVVDSMHAIMLGVIRTHIELLFDASRRKCWNISDRDSERMALKHITDVIDTRLLFFRPPSSISRTPRSISDYNIWKASEWRTFLLFYVVPCFRGLLKDKYVDHLAMLSKATYILHEKSVTRNNVIEAHNLLMEYTFLFQEYFGECNMTYNVHLLSHVCKCVLSWGPVWTHNAFMYEGQNRYLLELMASPNSVLVQMAKKFLVYRSIPLISSRLVTSEKTITFCEKVLDRKLSRFVQASKQVKLLGKEHKPHLNDAEIIKIEEHTGLPYKCFTSYSRMICSGMRFTTSLYYCGKYHDDSFALLRNKMFVKLNNILKSPNEKIVILGTQLLFERKCDLTNEKVVEMDHVKKVCKNEQRILCFDTDEIESQCVLATIHDCQFISKMPYGCYGD